MKLVDEGLKKIFDKAEVTDIIKAYGYLRNSGCYTRAESMSNALYHFDPDSVNEYDLIIHREYRDNTTFLEFYKLADVPHLQDYIAFCLTHTYSQGIPAMDIHEDAYDKVIEFETPSDLDMMYLLKDFKGMHMRRAEEREKHQFVDGVVMAEDEMMGGEMLVEPREADEADDLPRDVVEDMQQWGEAAPDEGFGNVVLNEETGGVRLTDNAELIFNEETGGVSFAEEDVVGGYTLPRNNIRMDELTGMIENRAREQREERINNGEELNTQEERMEDLMSNLDAIRRLLNR